MAQHLHTKSRRTPDKDPSRPKQELPVRQETVDTAVQPQPVALNTPLDPRSIVALQSTIGNAAVQRLIQVQHNAQELSFPLLQRAPPARPKPAWATDSKQTRAIQKHLKRIGTYRYRRADGNYGPYTDSALVETFGGDKFRRLDYATTLIRVAAAKPIGGKRGDERLRYGEMFRDGVLDITIGIGFDEGNFDKTLFTRYQAILAKKGFSKNDAKARKFYKLAGRPFVKGPAYSHFVKENALTYTPPVGSPRPIHSVIRLVSNTTRKHGAAASKAFQEGMARSDVAHYTGHGRYGSGPDFDSNFEAFILYGKDKKIELLIKDYKVFQHHLKNEGRKPGRSAWKQFLWREKQGRIKVLFSNAGNIYVNPKNYHPHEFGARLIYWALKKGHAKLASGKTGSIAGEMAKSGNQRYRVIVLAGCRTKDYYSSLRGTPGLNKKSAHLFDTTKAIGKKATIAYFEAFLTSLLSQFSANQIVKAMNVTSGRNPFRSKGTKYDPKVP